MLCPEKDMTMKTIERDEIFENLKRFLKSRGIELQEGSYTRGIQNGCGILADTVNLSQRALARARTEMGKRLGQVRQAIHEKSAPASPPRQPPRAGSGKTPKAGRRPPAKSASAKPRSRRRR